MAKHRLLFSVSWYRSPSLPPPPASSQSPADHEVLHRGPRYAINPGHVGEVHALRQITPDLPFLAIQLGARRPLGTPQKLSLSPGTPQPFLGPLGDEIPFDFRH